MPKLVLVRHGQSLWNQENRFTGWIDVPLTAQGEQEARNAGERLRGLKLDVAYTSALKRAARTLDIILATIPLDLPIISDKALNERDYGDLSGLNKDEMRAKYGEEQVHVWRRSFDVRPPGGEALKDTAERTLPFFERAIMGDIRQGKNVLVAAHGNSNRSIVMGLENMSPDAIVALELATGVPRIYDLDTSGAVLNVSMD
ncbi:MAG: 2,3-bisphosphoglycerate-dependent phosphoglycerate mutase [Armatimonadetes bacterium]|nr:2,3-bisphosphoglycerate-dependent phosphoglycerate mutase [Armatimonadota bacterium]